MPPTNIKDLKSEELLGVGAESVSSDSAAMEDHRGHALSWREINRVLFVAPAAESIWFLGGARDPYVLGIGVICTPGGGFSIFHEAYKNSVQLRMTMELSMAIAIVAALTIREIFTALVITLFVLVAEILEGLTVGLGRKAIQPLVNLLPSTATGDAMGFASTWRSHRPRPKTLFSLNQTNSGGRRCCRWPFLR
jgi:cation transport ATPase